MFHRLTSWSLFLEANSQVKCSRRDQCTQDVVHRCHHTNQSPFPEPGHEEKAQATLSPSMTHERGTGGAEGDHPLPVPLLLLDHKIENTPLEGEREQGKGQIRKKYLCWWYGMYFFFLSSSSIERFFLKAAKKGCSWCAWLCRNARCWAFMWFTAKGPLRVISHKVKLQVVSQRGTEDQHHAAVSLDPGLNRAEQHCAEEEGHERCPQNPKSDPCSHIQQQDDQQVHQEEDTAGLYQLVLLLISRFCSAVACCSGNLLVGSLSLEGSELGCSRSHSSPLWGHLVPKDSHK